MKFELNLELIETELKKYFEQFEATAKNSEVAKAINYSLFSGGKRLRPAMMLAFFKALGKNAEEVLPLACALEMIHTYSLIHDDLPCMDDDEFRRGQKSCHSVFGEATALLAGNALLTLAFEIANSAKSKEAAVILATASNYMILGQAMELQEENPTEEKLLEIYKLKTGALFSVTTTIPAILANLPDEKIKAAKEFGEIFGICFQLADDIDDNDGAEKKEELLSKHINILRSKFEILGVRKELLDWTMKFLKI